MAYISLIVPTTTRSPLDAERAISWRQALEDAGHSVEWIVAGEGGLATSALAGLREAEGDVLLIVDPTLGYRADDLVRVVEPLARGEFDLAIASRFHPGSGFPRGPKGWAGALARIVAGTSDPLSGLVAISRGLFVEALDELRPSGKTLAVEWFSRSDARRVEIAVVPDRGARRATPSLDDLRLLKRLADHRFGIASRLIQFCAVGASGMVVDLGAYALFQWMFGRLDWAGRTAPIVGGPLGLAAAGALSIAMALVWNFSLNRRLTFSDARHGSLIRQFVAYVLGNALGVALSFTLRMTLPRYFGFFQAHRLAAALVGIIAATGISFSMSRWIVFRTRTSPQDEPEIEIADPARIANVLQSVQPHSRSFAGPEVLEFSSCSSLSNGGPARPRIDLKAGATDRSRAHF